MKLQLRHPSILSDQLVATDICHVSHREDKLWCVMNPEWQLESSTLWKEWGSRNKNNPLSISEVWWMNTTVNLIKLLSFGFCQAAYQIILIFPNLKKQMLCPDGNTSGKKKLTIWKWFAGVMKESGAGARRKGGRAITQWEVGGTMRGKVERAQILRITQSKTCFSSTCSQYCLWSHCGELIPPSLVQT